MERIRNPLKPVYKDYNNPGIPTMISIITAKQCARISIDEIEMIEQEARVLHVITADVDYCIYEKIDTLAPYLDGRGFYRPLNCLIINFDRVKKMENSYVYFESGQCTTMGRNAYSKTRAAYRKYLDQYPQYFVTDRHYKVAEKH